MKNMIFDTGYVAYDRNASGDKLNTPAFRPPNRSLIVLYLYWIMHTQQENKRRMKPCFSRFIKATQLARQLSRCVNTIKLETVLMKTEINSLMVKQFGSDAGASAVGIASANDFTLAPDGFKPSEVLDGCLSVIVLGVPFPQEALSMNPPEYTALRNAFLTKMTDIAKIVAKKITKESGYTTKAISASGGRTVNGNLYGHISLKHAAELAGIGVVARNYLLTSPEYGNLLWLSAVLTDAELIPDKKLQYNICENCSKCVQACPSGALDNPASFGKKECSKFFVIENKKFVIKCFSCRSVCPHRVGTSSHDGYR